MYHVTFQGCVNASWSDLVSNMVVMTTMNEDGVIVTTLTGEMVNQAMLMGVLNNLYELQTCICLSYRCNGLMRIWTEITSEC